MHCLMLYPRASTNLQNNAFEWLQSEAANCGVNLTIAFFEDIQINYPRNILLINGREIQKPDCLIMRGYNAAISLHFEQQNVWAINPWQAMQNSLNKVLTHNLLTQNNIPNPPIIFSPSANYNFDTICKEFDDERFIVKKTDGSKGQNVFLVSSPSELSAAISSCQNDCLCQKFIGHSRGRDIRVWVIGAQVAGAVQRFNPNSFLSNFSQGGSSQIIEIPKEVEKLALQSAKTVGLQFAGVDILYNQNDLYTVCEVNGNAGFRTISQFSTNLQNNIPHQLFTYIHNQQSKK